MPFKAYECFKNLPFKFNRFKSNLAIMIISILKPVTQVYHKFNTLLNYSVRKLVWVTKLYPGSGKQTITKLKQEKRDNNNSPPPTSSPHTNSDR